MKCLSKKCLVTLKEDNRFAEVVTHFHTVRQNFATDRVFFKGLDLSPPTVPILMHPQRRRRSSKIFWTYCRAETTRATLH
jgi:hypothetical protein